MTQVMCCQRLNIYFTCYTICNTLFLTIIKKQDKQQSRRMLLLFRFNSKSNVIQLLLTINNGDERRVTNRTETMITPYNQVG